MHPPVPPQEIWNASPIFFLAVRRHTFLTDSAPTEGAYTHIYDRLHPPADGLTVPLLRMKSVMSVRRYAFARERCLEHHVLHTFYERLVVTFTACKLLLIRCPCCVSTRQTWNEVYQYRTGLVPVLQEINVAQYTLEDRLRLHAVTTRDVSTSADPCS